MGMFDSVHVDCPHCGKPVEFQSKEDECALNWWAVEEAPTTVLYDILNAPVFHLACGKWVVLIDPNVPPGPRPRPMMIKAMLAKEPLDGPDPYQTSQGLRWWPRNFTYADLETEAGTSER